MFHGFVEISVSGIYRKDERLALLSIEFIIQEITRIWRRNFYFYVHFNLKTSQSSFFSSNLSVKRVRCFHFYRTFVLNFLTLLLIDAQVIFFHFRIWWFRCASLGYLSFETYFLKVYNFSSEMICFSFSNQFRLTLFYKIELFEGFRFLEILFGRIASNLFLASQIICSSFFPRRPSTSGFCYGLWHFVFLENLSPFLVLWEGNLLYLCLEFTET